METIENSCKLRDGTFDEFKGCGERGTYILGNCSTAPMSEHIEDQWEFKALWDES